MMEHNPVERYSAQDVYDFLGKHLEHLRSQENLFISEAAEDLEGSSGASEGSSESEEDEDNLLDEDHMSPVRESRELKSDGD